MDDLKASDFCLSENVISYTTFASMNLKMELLKGIYAYAQSGTGKTATFSIGTLQNIRVDVCHVQVLVLAPTRELALQIYQVISSLSDYLSIRCVVCCGGKSNSGQMARELSKGVHVIVGTPGRVLELIRQGGLQLNKLQSLVLDEADEMLNRGLRDQLKQIYCYLPKSDQIRNLSGSKCQIVIVSATMPKEHLELFQDFTINPIRVLVPRDELSLSALKQFYIDVGSEEWKFEALCDLFASVCVPQTVVFVNTRRKVGWLSGQLNRKGFTVGVAHGDLDQTQREFVMEQFRSGQCRILVSSDIWARGIDVQAVGLVVNYDLPIDISEYLHRIGRSGRFGRRGLAVSLICGRSRCVDERKRLKTIADYYQISILPAPVQLDKMLVADNSNSVQMESIPKDDSMLNNILKKTKRKRKRKKHIAKLLPI